MSLLLCMVLAISDGDSLKVKCDGRKKPISVRLLNIDAPEVKHSGFVKMPDQPYGQAAKANLMTLCYKKNAVVHTVSLDRYGRTLANVECAGVKVNEAQAAAGYAWVLEPQRGSKVPAMVAAAKAANKGLWADPAPIPPSNWRKGQRN